MKRKDWIIIGLVVGLAGVIFAGNCYRAQAEEWERQVRVVLVQAESLDERARAAEERAESAAADARALAEELHAQEPIIRERIVQLPPPVTARDTAADAIIEELVVESAGWQEAYELQLQASADLKLANADLRARGDSLVVVLEDRPKKHPWFLPRLGVGPYAGIDSHGKPSVGPIAIHLAWELKI